MSFCIVETKGYCCIICGPNIFTTKVVRVFLEHLVLLVYVCGKDSAGCALPVLLVYRHDELYLTGSTPMLEEDMLSKQLPGQ